MVQQDQVLTLQCKNQQILQGNLDHQQFTVHFFPGKEYEKEYVNSYLIQIRW